MSFDMYKLHILNYLKLYSNVDTLVMLHTDSEGFQNKTGEINNKTLFL